jgi:hypothetical protein
LFPAFFLFDDKLPIISFYVDLAQEMSQQAESNNLLFSKNTERFWFADLRRHRGNFTRNDKSAYAHGYESDHLAASELHISNKQQFSHSLVHKEESHENRTNLSL